MEYEAKPKSDKRAETLLQVIGDLLTEIHPHHPHVERITLDSSFEKELGLDSLSRVEHRGTSCVHCLAQKYLMRTCRLQRFLR
jgi:hypothetical protein